MDSENSGNVAFGMMQQKYAESHMAGFIQSVGFHIVKHNRTYDAEHFGWDLDPNVQCMYGSADNTLIRLKNGNHKKVSFSVVEIARKDFMLTAICNCTAFTTDGNGHDFCAEALPKAVKERLQFMSCKVEKGDHADCRSFK